MVGKKSYCHYCAPISLLLIVKKHHKEGLMLTHYVHFTTLLWELGSVLSELTFHCDQQFKMRAGWYKRAINVSNAHSTLGI